MKKVISVTGIQVEQTVFTKYYHTRSLNAYIGLENNELIQKGLTSGMKLLFADAHRYLLESNGLVNNCSNVY